MTEPGGQVPPASLPGGAEPDVGADAAPGAADGIDWLGPGRYYAERARRDSRQVERAYEGLLERLRLGRSSE